MGAHIQSEICVSKLGSYMQGGLIIGILQFITCPIIFFSVFCLLQSVDSESDIKPQKTQCHPGSVPPPRQNLKFSIPPQNHFSPGIFKSDFPPTDHFFMDFHSNLGNIKLGCQSMCKLEFEPYSTMVGENFEIFMSEMPTNVVNCQKSDFPPGRNLKIQIPPQNLSQAL